MSNEAVPTPQAQPNPTPSAGTGNTAEPAAQPNAGAPGAGAGAPASGQPERRQGPPETVPYHRVQELAHENRAIKEKLARFEQGLAAMAGGQPQAGADPDPEPQEEGFQNIADFIIAKASWSARKEADARWNAHKQGEAQQADKAKFQARFGSAVENWNTQYTAEVAKDPGFAQAVQGLQLTDSVRFMVMESKAAAAVAKHLHAHPDMQKQLNGMPIDQAAYMLGEIGAQFVGPNGQPQKKPSAGMPTLEPVGQGLQSGSVNVYSSKSSMGDYLAATRPLPG